MKITHNKVGQNLNLLDGVKQSRSEPTKNISDQNQNLASVVANNGATKVDLSPRAQEAKRIKEIAMAAPDVDQEKVNRFQKLIDEGKYKVDARAVADKMVDEHLETRE